ncbi:MAG: transposase [Caulobacterales bacterium]|nr:transposase [Caulobacterales bacterium]
MARMARVVVPGVPHHVTQRGNRRQTTFFREEDYLAWLTLAAEAFADAGVEIWAYCLMPNHVHLIAAPARPEGLAQAMGTTHVRYTRQVNGRERWTGHLWQGRFASFPMDEDYLRQCIRYVGLNPVRAGLTTRAIDWPWSSVRAHVEGRPDALLTPGPVADRLGATMAGFFDLDLEEEGRRRLRKASRDGRPLGAADWVKALEAASGRALAPPRRGRPPLSLIGDSHSFARK